MRKEVLTALAGGLAVGAVVALSSSRATVECIQEVSGSSDSLMQSEELGTDTEKRLRRITGQSERSATTSDTNSLKKSDDIISMRVTDLAHILDMMECRQELDRSILAHLDRADRILQMMATYRPLLAFIVTGAIMSIIFIKLAEQKRIAEQSMVSEQQMRSQKDKLENVMRQRERFIATLAHDMKVPLVGADRVFGLMIDQKVSTSTIQQSELLKKLRQSNAEVLTKLQDMIEIYRYENPHLTRPHTPANMADLLRRCVDRIAPFAALQGIKIESDVDAVDRNCKIDELGIERLVLSLLDNAVKFSDKDSVISLSTNSSPDELQIKVTDMGEGISSEDQHRLFNGMWSGEVSRDRTSGNGLGLYLAKLVAEAHGGSIDCISELGKGSTFTVHIPIS